MTNDNDLLLLASSQNNGTYKVYIDSSGRKTLTPQTYNYEARYKEPYVCYHTSSTVKGLLADKNPKKVVFPNCSEASGKDNYGTFYYAFQNCTSLTSVSFPSLTTVTGDGDYGTFEYAFNGCTSLTSVSFPSLTTVTGDGDYGTFYSAFQNCTSLTSVSFPSLTTATGGSSFGSFYSAFQNCTSLTSVSFPSLTSVKDTTRRWGTFYYAFKECSPSLKVHFKKSMEGTTGLDYSTMGLTSADQVVFDLP